MNRRRRLATIVAAASLLFGFAAASAAPATASNHATADRKCGLRYTYPDCNMTPV